VWQFLLASLRFLDRVVDGAERTRFQGFVRELVGPALAATGWEPATGEESLRGELRGQLIRAAAVLGADAAAVDRARTLYERSTQDTAAVSPPVAAACAGVVAATGDAARYDEFVERFHRAATPQERQRFLHLLAEFPTDELMDRTMTFAFSKEVRTQDAPFLIAYCIANRDQGWRAWSEVRKRWDEANTVFPTNTIRPMVSSVRLLMRPEQQADVSGFFAEHPIPQAAKTLSQVLERQRVNVAVREREHDRFGLSLA
jgi:puromycin-sensitive aminopeptidase